MCQLQEKHRPVVTWAAVAFQDKKLGGVCAVNVLRKLERQLEAGIWFRQV